MPCHGSILLPNRVRWNCCRVCTLALVWSGMLHVDGVCLQEGWITQCLEGMQWKLMVSRRAVALILTESHSWNTLLFARYSLGRRKPHYARRQSFKMYQSCINLPRSYQVVNTWFSRSWSMIRYNECPCCSARYGWGPHQQKHCLGNHYCALNSLKIKQNCIENYHCMIVWYSTRLVPYYINHIMPCNYCDMLWHTLKIPWGK